MDICQESMLLYAVTKVKGQRVTLSLLRELALYNVHAFVFDLDLKRIKDLRIKPTVLF